MIRLQNILIPTDFSEPAMAATQHALHLAKTFRSTVHLLYVIDEPSFQIHGFGGYIPGREEFEAYGDTGLANWIDPEDERGVTVIRVKEIGKTATKIVDYARANEIDLVVMGTHGRSPVTRGLIGSVAESVVRHAPCPVLTIHPDGHPFVSEQDSQAIATTELEG